MNKRKYFATDGIRGRVNTSPVTPEVALRVGMAVGEVFHRGPHRHRVVIGKDTRLSGYMIENALTAGFSALGMDVLLLGPIPTPGVAMLVRSMRADIGVVISASHNTFEYNGIKLFGPDGYKLDDQLELEIEALIDSVDERPLAEPPDLGRVRRLEGVHARYVEHVKRTLSRKVDLSGMRIVLDCANGAAYRVAPEALWELGAEVIAIGVEPNGININKECGSTHLQAIARKVHEVRADIGIALDGDADRVVIVDERGEIVDGDQILAVIASELKKVGRVDGNAVVGTVMSNLGLERYLSELDLDFHRVAVGDRAVVEKMRSGGFSIGGEPSGHIVLSDYGTTGDGLVAALQILAVVRLAGGPVSSICHKFTPIPQELRNLKVVEWSDLQAGPIQERAQEWQRKLRGEGRLLVRASGTEPVVRIMAECEERSRAREVVDDMAAFIGRMAV